MHIVLVLVRSAVHLTPLNDACGVELAVPPLALQVGADFQRQAHHVARHGDAPAGCGPRRQPRRVALRRAALAVRLAAHHPLALARTLQEGECDGQLLFSVLGWVLAAAASERRQAGGGRRAPRGPLGAKLRSMLAPHIAELLGRSGRATQRPAREFAARARLCALHRCSAPPHKLLNVSGGRCRPLPFKPQPGRRSGRESCLQRLLAQPCVQRCMSHARPAAQGAERQFQACHWRAAPAARSGCVAVGRPWPHDRMSGKSSTAAGSAIASECVSHVTAGYKVQAQVCTTHAAAELWLGRRQAPAIRASAFVQQNELGRVQSRKRKQKVHRLKVQVLGYKMPEANVTQVCKGRGWPGMRVK